MSLCFLLATVPLVPVRYSFPAPAIPMEQPYQKQVLSFHHELFHFIEYCIRYNFDNADDILDTDPYTDTALYGTDDYQGTIYSIDTDIYNQYFTSVYGKTNRLEDRTIEVWAYNLETVLAEKLETVVSRNVTNTRMRDFYDIYILQKLYGEQLQKQVLWTALVATAKKRGTLDLIEAEDIREIFDEIESSPVMETLWKTYQKNYSYAADISWHAIVKSICALYGSILENMYDT